MSLPARPLVSAIIPTRNRAVLLRRALDSVFAQEGIGKVFDIEAVVVDDASSDATADVVRCYPQARCIRLMTQRGVAVARNTGIAASKGMFVAFLDDDDEWFAHRLKLQVPALESHPEVGAVYSEVPMPERHRNDGGGGRQTSDRSQDTRGDSCPSGWIFGTLIERCFLATTSILVRRQAFEIAGYFDESLATYEDWDLWLRLSFYFPFLFVPGVVAVYNPSSRGLWLTAASNGSGADDATRVIEKALRMLPESARSGEVTRRARARGRACNNWSRAYLTRITCNRILAAESPVLAAREFTAGIKAAAPQRNIRERWMVRRVTAEIWLEVARSVMVGARTSKRAAVYYATCAVLDAPSYHTLRALARVIVRSFLGPRADVLYGRLRAGLERRARHRAT